MLEHLDDALERFLRAAVPLPAAVDVSFATPDRRWSSTITNPTVNLFLWEIVSDPERTALGVEEQRVDGFVVARRALPTTVNMRYVVTCWASHQRDEHQLLGAVLRTIVASPRLPAEHLPAEIADLVPVGLVLGSALERKPGDFWSSLDGQLKPNLELTAVIGLTNMPWAPAGPPTTAVGVEARPLPEEPSAPATDGHAAAPPMQRRRRGTSSVVNEPVNGGNS